MRAVHRAGCVSVSVDRLGVECAPLPVDAADPIQDRAVRVQLRIADTLAGGCRARRAMTELGDDEPVPVHLAHPARTRTGVPGVVVEVLQRDRHGLVVGGENGCLHFRTRRERPQQRHRLRRRERHVERGDRLGNGPVRTHARRHLAAENLLVQPSSRWQPRPAGGRRHHEPAVQRSHVVGIHLTRETEQRGASPGPSARCLAGAGVVVVLRRGDLTSEVLVARPGGDPAYRRDHDVASRDPAQVRFDRTERWRNRRPCTDSASV